MCDGLHEQGKKIMEVEERRRKNVFFPKKEN